MLYKDGNFYLESLSDDYFKLRKYYTINYLSNNNNNAYICQNNVGNIIHFLLRSGKNGTGVYPAIQSSLKKLNYGFTHNKKKYTYYEKDNNNAIIS